MSVSFRPEADDHLLNPMNRPIDLGLGPNVQTAAPSGIRLTISAGRVALLMNSNRPP